MGLLRDGWIWHSSGIYFPRNSLDGLCLAHAVDGREDRPSRLSPTHARPLDSPTDMPPLSLPGLAPRLRPQSLLSRSRTANASLGLPGATALEMRSRPSSRSDLSSSRSPSSLRFLFVLVRQLRVSLTVLSIGSLISTRLRTSASLTSCCCAMSS